jgi:HK97 family phage major capsid protein
MVSKSFGDFLKRVATIELSHDGEMKDAQRRDLKHIYGIEKAALAGTSGTTGGYTVPPEFSTGIFRDIAEQSIFRNAGAYIQPMTAATMLLPLPAATTVPSAAGIPPWFGGMTFGYNVEAATLVETEPTFNMVELRANELSGYITISNPLLDDGGAPLEGFLRRIFANCAAWVEDYFFLNGNGVGKPMGVLNAACAISVTRGTANKIQQADVSAMIGKLIPSSFTRAAWIVAVDAVNQLTQLADASGRSSFVPNDGIENLAQRTGKPIGSLLSLPVYPTEKTPALGTKGDLILLDPALYVIGDRGEVQIDVSREASLSMWQKNLAVFRVILRSDGQPWLNKIVTLADVSRTVSSIVILN